jgi:hypothetical protein
MVGVNEKWKETNNNNAKGSSLFGTEEKRKNSYTN